VHGGRARPWRPDRGARRRYDRQERGRDIQRVDDAGEAADKAGSEAHQGIRPYTGRHRDLAWIVKELPARFRHDPRAVKSMLAAATNGDCRWAIIRGKT